MVLKNLCCGKSHDNGEESLRQVVPVHLLPESVKRSSHRHPHYGYKGNKVCTTKYNLITFLPRNLFEQFHRVANIIFLLIGLLNFLPSVNALIPEIALLPLLFVLFVTAVKDAYEDYRRFRSDKEINNLTCRKYSRTERRYVKTHWSQLHVGDFVHLSCNEAIPADLILIRSSDKDGICRIDTSNLDGENNLKQRIVVKGVPQGDEFHPTLFTHNIECDQPNMKIYDFNGSMVDVMQQRTPINTDNFLLRGCIIRNTAYVEGIIVYAGHETKAMLNNRGPRYKQSKIEHQINRDILFCMAIMLFMCFLSALGNGLWLQSVDNPEGVIYLQFAQDNLYDAPYAAFLSFWTFIIVYQAFIPLALYVTIELVKLGQVFFIQQDIHMYHSASDRRIQCRALNITEELGQIEHVFSDKTGTLTENQMLFKRCTIGGLDYAYPPREVIDDNISVFGSDSLAGGSLHDLSLSGSSPSSPPTTPQVIPTTPKLGKFLPDPTLHQAVSMMSLHSISAVNDAIPEEMGRIQEFFLIMAICNTVVVTAQPHQDNMDDTGVVREIETKPPPKLYNRFKQKILRKQGAAAKVKSPTSKSPRHSLGSNGFLANASTENLTYVSEADSDSISTMLMSENPDGCYYEAESPDELALTQAACLYGCKLLNRTVDHATVWLPAESEEVKVDVLHILPFDSQRKRMSVIVRVNNNNLVLYCKGADSNIFSNLKPFTTDDDDADKIVYNQTQRYITEYARQGLRTLCMAKKTLDEDTYTEWLKDHRLAEDAVTERGSLLYESACRMETDLTLLGATGIEDRLQDGVAETIDSLRMAGIKVWVLTGDKQETAMNIAYSCNLLSFDQEIIALNARNQVMTTDLIREHLSNVNSSHNTDHCNDVKEKALVIDGVTLAYALNPEVADDFVKLTSHCSSVLCCRTTPSQKAAVVTLVKEKQKKLTLAIGDGANDVSMIQTGDVGVGISGQEGMQAVMASDFALPRFRFLKRLLLVHGHWCYDRLARMICLMYYKNAAFVNLLMWFQIFNGFSGVAQVDDINLLIFSVVYTSIPPIVMGVLDQNMPDSTLMAFPHLYDRCQSSKSYRWYDLFLSLGDALWQSAAQFFIPYFAFLGSNVGVYEMGFLMNTACVVCFFCHYAIESFHWHVIHIIGVLVSLLLFVATNYVCSILSTSYPPLSTVYGVFVNTTSMVEFWLLLPIVIVVALLPRFVMRSLQGSLWPHRCLRVRQYHKQIEKLNAQKLKNSENNGHIANGNGIIRNHEEDRLNTNGRVPNGGLTSNGQVTNSQSVELQAPAVSFENGTTTIYDDDVVISNTRF